LTESGVPSLAPAISIFWIQTCWKILAPPPGGFARPGCRSPYALRHTFATFGIAAGVALFELARFMGTSVEQIARTYGHLLPDSIDRARVALDAFVSGACPAEEAENGR
jgi:integrase